jgi:CRISPR-associated protein Cas2
MTYLICYDIADNKKRNKVSKLLEKFGTRIQRSIFMSDLNLKQYSIISLKLVSFISDDDSIFIIPICRNCLDNSKYLGNKNDKAVVI